MHFSQSKIILWWGIMYHCGFTKRNKTHTFPSSSTHFYTGFILYYSSNVLLDSLKSIKICTRNFYKILKRPSFVRKAVSSSLKIIWTLTIFQDSIIPVCQVKIILNILKQNHLSTHGDTQFCYHKADNGGCIRIW